MRSCNSTGFLRGGGGGRVGGVRGGKGGVRGGVGRGGGGRGGRLRAYYRSEVPDIFPVACDRRLATIGKGVVLRVLTSGTVVGWRVQTCGLPHTGSKSVQQVLTTCDVPYHTALWDTRSPGQR